MAINLNDNVNVLANRATDYRFGPFDTISVALDTIKGFQRYRGLTVGIGNPVVVEYWFKDGIADLNFVPKTASGNLTGVTAGNGISVTGSATNPTIAVTAPTQLTTNLSTDIIADAANAVKYPNVPAVKTYVDGLVVGLLNDRGSYAPSGTTGGPYPSSGGSGSGGAILKGDIWYIRSDGYLLSTFVYTGASVRALVNSPSPTNAAQWDILDAGLGYVPEDSANRVVDGSGIVPGALGNDIKYPSVKALTEYLLTYTPSVPSLQSVLDSGVNTNISTGTSIIVQNSGITQVSTISPGAISLTDTGTSRTIALGSDDRLRIQKGSVFTTYEFDRITFNSASGTSTLQARPGNIPMFLPAPGSSNRTLAISVNGEYANNNGNITLPSTVGSGDPNILTKWTSAGNAIEDSQIYDDGTNVGIDTTSPLAKLHIGGNLLVEGVSNLISAPASSLSIEDTGPSGPSLNFYSNDGSGKTKIDSSGSLVIEAGDVTVTPATTFSDTITCSNQVFVGTTPSYGGGKLMVGGVIYCTELRLDGPLGIGSATPSYGTSGQYLKSNGTGTAPSWSNLPPIPTVSGTGNRVGKFTGSGASTAIGDSQIFDDGTNVGIGTISPTEKLQVSGNLLLTEVGVPSDNDSYAIKLQGKGTTGTNQTGEIKIDASGTAATQGCLQFSTSGFMRFSSGSTEGYAFTGSPAILRNNSGGMTLQAFSASQGIVLRNNTSQTSGKLLSVVNSGNNEPLTILASTGTEANVGINFATPARSLHIKDVMRLEPRSSDPSSGSAGDIYYNSSVNKLRIHNGTTWRTVQFEP
jgi:hypothetical protein